MTHRNLNIILLATESFEQTLCQHGTKQSEVGTMVVEAIQNWVLDT